MPVIAKALATLAVAFFFIEYVERHWRRSESRHLGYPQRRRAEKSVALVTALFSAVVILLAVWGF